MRSPTLLLLMATLVLSIVVRGENFTYTLGGEVYYDLNGNGLRDADEHGVANLEVEISYASTLYTDDNGEFTHTYVSEKEASCHRLEFPSSPIAFTFPQGGVVTPGKWLQAADGRLIWYPGTTECVEVNDGDGYYWSIAVLDTSVSPSLMASSSPSLEPSTTLPSLEPSMSSFPTSPFVPTVITTNGTEFNEYWGGSLIQGVSWELIEYYDNWGDKKGLVKVLSEEELGEASNLAPITLVLDAKHMKIWGRAYLNSYDGILHEVTNNTITISRFHHSMMGGWTALIDEEDAYFRIFEGCVEGLSDCWKDRVNKFEYKVKHDGTLELSRTTERDTFFDGKYPIGVMARYARRETSLAPSISSAPTTSSSPTASPRPSTSSSSSPSSNPTEAPSSNPTEAPQPVSVSDVNNSASVWADGNTTSLLLLLLVLLT